MYLSNYLDISSLISVTVHVHEYMHEPLSGLGDD